MRPGLQIVSLQFWKAPETINFAADGAQKSQALERTHQSLMQCTSSRTLTCAPSVDTQAMPVYVVPKSTPTMILWIFGLSPLGGKAV